MIANDGEIPKHLRTKKFAQRLLPKTGEIKVLQSLPVLFQMILFITTMASFINCKRGKITNIPIGINFLANELLVV